MEINSKMENQPLSPKNMHVCTHVIIISKHLMAQKSRQINIICKCGEFSKNPSKNI
jgi:hypothetical protein